MILASSHAQELPAQKSPLDPRIEIVQRFEVVRQENIEGARSFLVADPRVWYEARTGDGRAWDVGNPGLWRQWDEHFGSSGEILRWEAGDTWVASIHSEMNDYFRLLERNGSWYRKTWFFNAEGKIEGYMIAAWEDAPEVQDRSGEFVAWAQENHADEWAYLRPGGRIDPSGDRAARTRALLVQWRQDAGLAELDLATSGIRSQMEFWDALASLCGKSFAGRLVDSHPADAALAGKRFVMHVRRCGPNEIRIPFHIGENRSRTWVVTRTSSGLRLKHVHRHEDGSLDAVTQYGGDTKTPGSPARQEFFADDYTAQLIPEARTNVWSLEIHPKIFVYALRREGTERRFRAEFDLQTTIPPPPAPWGGND